MYQIAKVKSETRGKVHWMALQEADQLVIFGISGDLAKKMTIPSLYRLERRELLKLPILGVAFDAWTEEQFIAHARESVETVEGSVDDAVFTRLADRITYIHGDFTDDALYQEISKQINGKKAPCFYLEIPPGLFVVVAQNLAKADLLHGDARVVFEKPFGTDYDSAKQLNDDLHKIMREDQVFRLDHYLGKDQVQDILYVRFSNTFFEPLWDRHYVDSIMITMAEDFGVEDRGSFYDKVGTLRDVVQNHLLQTLSLVTMEVPTDDFAITRYDLFRTIPSLEPEQVVRGQYEGYQEIKGVAENSDTETFIAAKFKINSLRWSGVPVFIRAGKNMPVKATEVVVRMKMLPPFVINGRLRASRWYDDVVFRLGSKPGLNMAIRVKQPGLDKMEPVELNLDFQQAEGGTPEPYEVLLMGAIHGVRALFPDEGTIEETWRIVQPVIDNPPPVISYKSGTWGPDEAQKMTEKHGGWREPTI